jgi:type II secretory pathway pseudopilin PulG
MKLTNTHNLKAKSGMTLLELTVVILVLLSLISVLFIGARAWKKGSDRAASVLAIRGAQVAVRSYANLNNKNENDPVTAADFVGIGKFMSVSPISKPHPGGTGLTFIYGASNGAVPAIGSLYIVPDGTASDGTLAAYYLPDTNQITDW